MFIVLSVFCALDPGQRVCSPYDAFSYSRRALPDVMQPTCKTNASRGLRAGSRSSYLLPTRSVRHHVKALTRAREISDEIRTGLPHAVARRRRSARGRSKCQNQARRRRLLWAFHIVAPRKHAYAYLVTSVRGLLLRGPPSTRHRPGLRESRRGGEPLWVDNPCRYSRNTRSPAVLTCRTSDEACHAHARACLDIR